MEMHDERNRECEGIMGDANEYLFAIGLIDTVDTFLNSEAVHTIVKAAYSDGLKEVKEFAEKMPEKVKEAARKVIEETADIEDAIRGHIFHGFKMDLAEALKGMEGYVSTESLVAECLANPARELMWNRMFTNGCNEMMEMVWVQIKAFIVADVIKIIDNPEDLHVLTEVVENEPNCEELLKQTLMSL